MAQVMVVYWRDIPAQVIAGKGRRATKVVLPERFEQAIDRAAMKSGASETDAYLADWRKSDPFEVEGDDATATSALGTKLDAEYDQDKLKALIDNGGFA